MTKKIKVTRIKIECALCPMALNAETADGQSLYVRFRWGQLSIRLGGAEGACIYAAKVGTDEYAGWIEYETLKDVTRDLIEWPENEPERPEEPD